MPDESALDYAYTLEGEHAMKADRLRREAYELRRQAEGLLHQAAWQDERAAWAKAFAEALRGEDHGDGLAERVGAKRYPLIECRDCDGVNPHGDEGAAEFAREHARETGHHVVMWTEYRIDLGGEDDTTGGTDG